jgi:transcriptional regulator with XRE-family HTH domain
MNTINEVSDGNNGDSLDTLGVRVRFARMQKRLTQFELAERLGVTQQAIEKLENDKVKNPRGIITLCGVLDVSLEWLMKGEGDMKRGFISDIDSTIIGSLKGITRSQKLEVLQVVNAFKSKNLEVIEEIGSAVNNNKNISNQLSHYA